MIAFPDVLSPVAKSEPSFQTVDRTQTKSAGSSETTEGAVSFERQLQDSLKEQEALEKSLVEDQDEFHEAETADSLKQRKKGFRDQGEPQFWLGTTSQARDTFPRDERILVSKGESGQGRFLSPTLSEPTDSLRLSDLSALKLRSLVETETPPSLQAESAWVRQGHQDSRADDSRGAQIGFDQAFVLPTELMTRPNQTFTFNEPLSTPFQTLVPSQERKAENLWPLGDIFEVQDNKELRWHWRTEGDGGLQQLSFFPQETFEENVTGRVQNLQIGLGQGFQIANTQQNFKDSPPIQLEIFEQFEGLKGERAFGPLSQNKDSTTLETLEETFDEMQSEKLEKSRQADDGDLGRETLTQPSSLKKLISKKVEKVEIRKESSPDSLWVQASQERSIDVGSPSPNITFPAGNELSTQMTSQITQALENYRLSQGSGVARLRLQDDNGQLLAVNLKIDSGRQVHLHISASSEEILRDVEKLRSDLKDNLEGKDFILSELAFSLDPAITQDFQSQLTTSESSMNSNFSAPQQNFSQGSFGDQKGQFSSEQHDDSTFSRLSFLPKPTRSVAKIHQKTNKVPNGHLISIKA